MTKRAAPLAQKLAAVRARKSLSEDEKRQAVYDLKGQAILAAFGPPKGRRTSARTFTRGNLSLTIPEPPEYKDGRITLRKVELRKNGQLVSLSLPIHIMNPPLLVRDAAGSVREDPAQAIRDVIMGLAD